MKKDKSMKENLLDEKGSSLKGILGIEKNEKDEPSEYEIYSMDIFLHYDEFNDGVNHQKVVLNVRGKIYVMKLIFNI